MPKRSVAARNARKIKYLILDVDGVMTDGGLYYSVDGHELKRFHAHDGYGIVRILAAGIGVGIISGRQTPIVDARAKALGIVDVYQGADDKVSAMRCIQKKYGYADDEFAFIADDLFDLPLLNLVGLSVAPRNALPEVRRAVHLVTKASGGDGAVRELVDFLLTQRNGVKRNVRPSNVRSKRTRT
jgi:3-deoxy-D-manno-octulosonate 8-phosphate phosphatase (KDO 8-P phosphatase)